MNKLVMDAHLNVYSFDGVKMKSLGKPEKFVNEWKNQVFRIGQDLYQKDGDSYRLLCGDSHHHAMLYRIDMPVPYIQNQFRLTDDGLLYYSAKNGIQLLDKAFEAPFESQPLTADLAFVIEESAGNYTVYLRDADGSIKPSPWAAVGLGHSGTNVFWWNGRAWSWQNDSSFRQVTCQLVFQNDAYLIFNAGAAAFLVTAQGLEADKIYQKCEIIQTPQAALMKFCGRNGDELWHLKPDKPQYFLSGSFEVNEDGTVYYSYVCDWYHDQPDIQVCEVFKFQDGEFRCIKHTEA